MFIVIRSQKGGVATVADTAAGETVGEAVALLGSEKDLACVEVWERNPEGHFIHIGDAEEVFAAGDASGRAFGVITDDPGCAKCGSGLLPNGFCGDITCPFSDRPQGSSYTEG